VINFDLSTLKHALQNENTKNNCHHSDSSNAPISFSARALLWTPPRKLTALPQTPMGRKEEVGQGSTERG